MQENKNITYENGNAIFRINPKIYPIDVVYSAAYMMTEKAFILLDGDPDKEITATISAKNKQQDVENLVEEFNDELLNYAVYKTQSEKNKELREAILKRVLITNQVVDCLEEIKKDIQKAEDPENILKAWEQR